MRFISQLVGLALVLIGGSVWSGEPATFDGRIRGAVQIAEGLHRCPDWYDTPASDVHTRQEITRIYADLAGYDTNTVRAGIELYVHSFSAKENERYTGAVKVFAFLRVFFKVPATLDWHRMPYSTWGNPHLDDTNLDFLWPYSVDEAGELVLTGEGISMSAPPYEALRDFDAMEDAKLERRFPVRSR